MMLQILVFTVLCAVPGRALGEVWEVTAQGDGRAPTIQAGIDSASAGDTVLVSPGTYPENIQFSGRPIVLKSSDGPSSTVIDGRQLGSVVTVGDVEGQGTVIDGFAITRGSSTEGGGIYCGEASVTIRNNWIFENHADFGGGIHAGTNRAGGERVPNLVEN
jgi:hypothetical protein